MRLTKQVLQQRYSQAEEEEDQNTQILSEMPVETGHMISHEDTKTSAINPRPQFSLDLSLGKLMAVFVMGMFMLVGPAILFENREQLVVAVVNTTQASNPSQTVQVTQTVQPTQPESQEGRVAGLSDQAGTSNGQTLSLIFFVVGALLLTVPVFVVLRL